MGKTFKWNENCRKTQIKGKNMKKMKNKWKTNKSTNEKQIKKGKQKWKKNEKMKTKMINKMIKNEDEKMIKNDQRNEKCNDNQNDKKWKKYFKDFQCVAGSFCQNYSISLRQLPPFLVRVLLAISDTCKNSSKQFVARDGQVSSGAVSVYKRT